LRTPGREDLLDNRAVVALGQACDFLGHRGEELAAIAIGHQNDAIFAILLEKSHRHAAKIPEVAVAQRVGERENLKTPGHALHLCIEHKANAAHGFEHALARLLAVLFVIMKHDADRERDQGQCGPRDQEDEPHGERRSWHASVPVCESRRSSRGP
jgi:hypothetical protein